MDRETVDQLILDPTIVGAESREILNNTEDHAHLVERTAKSIYAAWRLLRHAGDAVARAGIESVPFADAWNDLSARERIEYRQQARAALMGSELLDRVRDLEERIAAARRECVIYGGELNGQSLARKVNRVDRILAKPVPDPEPIGVKSKP